MDILTILDIFVKYVVPSLVSIIGVLIAYLGFRSEDRSRVDSSQNETIEQLRSCMTDVSDELEKTKVRLQLNEERLDQERELRRSQELLVADLKTMIVTLRLQVQRYTQGVRILYNQLLSAGLKPSWQPPEEVIGDQDR